MAPLADAQTAPDSAARLRLEVVTVGAAGGPFTVTLQRAAHESPVRGEATTSEADVAVPVGDLPPELADGVYDVGLDAASLPDEPEGGAWTFTELLCDAEPDDGTEDDREPVEIDPETGLAALPLPERSAPACEMTVTWAPDGETPELNPTLLAEQAAAEQASAEQADQEDQADTTEQTGDIQAEEEPEGAPGQDGTATTEGSGEPPGEEPATTDTTETTDTTDPTPTTDTSDTTEPPAAEEDEDDPPIVLQQISEGVLIRKAGGRSASGPENVTPLEGATMAAFESESDAVANVNPVGTCVTAADGTCEIALDGSGFGGTDYYIREIAAPPGYFLIEEIAAGRWEQDNPPFGETGEVIGGAEPYVEEVAVTNNDVVDAPPDQTSVRGSRNFERSFANALDNPDFPQECGLDIGMVVDVSESIDPTEQVQLKGALTDVANALVGTPTTMGMYSFATVAPSPYAAPNLAPVSLADSADPVLDWIDALPDDTGAPSDEQLTNWDQGLYQVAQDAASYDVVLLVTDGFPTAWGVDGDYEFWYPQGPLFAAAPVVAPSATEQAVASANELKAQGTKIVALGVGESDEVSVESLLPVTGPGDAFATGFDQLADDLVQAATQFCQGTVTVKKETRASETDAFAPAPGWTIDSPTAGVTPASAVTDDAGLASFEVDFADPTSPLEVAFAEVLQDGYELVPQDGFNAVCSTDNGANPIAVTDDGDLGFAFEMTASDIVSCTIRNQQAAATHLTLVKQVAGGGAAPTDWTLSATGPTPGVSGPSGDPAVTDVIVDPGTYVLSESGGPTGYSATDWACTGGGALSGGDTLTLTEGEDVSCTITNIAQPAELTLVKEVENDFGGTAAPTDWTLSATGPTPISGVTGDAAVTDAPVDAGRYVLSESGGPTGYSASAWTCTDGVETRTAFELVIDLGEDITCTIVNSDSPAVLTLVKEVVNDDGGTAVPGDWTLTADGPTIVAGPTGSPLVTGRVVSPGTYDLSESGPGGYTASDWTCEGGTQSGDSIDLAVGDDATCTIVNDDIPPQLTLVKQVENDHGGTAVPGDWTLSADGPTSVSGVTGDAAVTDVDVAPGDYTLSESGPDGYEASDWSCDGGVTSGDTLTLAVGDDVTCTIVNSDLPAELTLVKEVVNDDGGTALDTDWTLSGDGPTPITGVTGDAAITAATVDPGDYTLSESGPAGYTASDWSCDAGTLTGDALTLAPGDSATCTITNDDQPAELTLVKEVVNDDGGTAADTDWTLTGDGPTTGITGPTGAPAVTAVPVVPGDYDLSESGPDGYQASDWMCVGGSLTGETVTVALGDSVTCTIVNDDVPAQLTLVKTVVNDDGGTAVATDWTLTADGPTTGVSGPTGDPAVTAVDVLPGTYDLSETGPDGYQASDWTCTGGTQDTPASVTLAVGESATCEIVNDDLSAQLTLVKQVVNDDGGSAVATDWTLSADGPTDSVSGVSGSSEVTLVEVEPGTYALSETGGPTGYTASDWSCVGGTFAGGSVTLGSGESAVCTITNDDQPAELTLVKDVLNDDGGTAAATDWTLGAAGPTPGVSGVTGDAAITAAAVDAGIYLLGESGPDGYIPQGWSCTGALNLGPVVFVPLGGSVTCTIVNDDAAPGLTLVKEVVNDDGGTAAATDWTLSADGPTTGITGPTGDPAVTEVPVTAGDYTLSESGPDGYTTDGWACEGATAQTGGTVTIGVGETVVCTIVNDDALPTLTLVKTVTNDDGGTAAPGDWTLTATGPTPGVTGATGTDPVTSAPVAVGDYVLSESGPDGYAPSDWTCAGGTQTGTTVTIAVGDDVTCTIDNDDIAAELTLVKEVVNDDGGTAAATDWTLSADGPTTGVTGTTGAPAVTAVSVDAGDYVLSESGGPTDYAASDWSCVGGALTGDTVTVDLNGSVTCTIVNDDIPAELTLVKEVVNDDGGTSVPGDWALGAVGPVDRVVGLAGTVDVIEVPVGAGTYDLGEYGPPGYAASDWSCVGGTQDTATSVTLALGESATCTIVNDDIPAELTLVKTVTNDDGGTAVDTDWTLTADGPTAGVSGTTGSAPVTAAPVAPGDYVLSESGGPSGYTASDWTCTGDGTLEGGTISLALGESATCTIDNDDQPADLTLVKRVVNDNGGTAAAAEWTLSGDGPTTGITGPTGDPAVTAVPVVPGDYDLSESGGPDGYEPSDWACVGGALTGSTVSVANGDSVTCTIVNDDIPSDLTLVKLVVNDDGGTAVESDWILAAAGRNARSGRLGEPAVTQSAVLPGDYVLSESGPDGYTASDWTCEGGDIVGDVVTVDLGASVTCTIVNDDEPGELTLVKEVVNDDGGTAVDTDWTLDAAGPTTGITGPTGDAAVTGVVVDAGDYVLSESGGPDGYTASDWSCLGGALTGDTVTVPNGGSVTCTIVNDDEPGELTLVKEVVNDDGGTAVDTDWTLDAAGPTTGVTGPTGDAAVTAVVVDAGDYVLSESGGPGGYAASDWSCEGGALTGDTVTVPNGGSVTCTIVNDDEPGELTLVKEVVNDDGGTAVDTDWTLDAAGPTTGVTGPTGDAAVTAVVVDAGDYVLSESGPDGYAASDWSCEGGTLTDDTVTIALGESVTCTIVNDDQPADLTLVKEVVDDDGGTAVDTDWTLDAAGPTTGITGPTGDPAVTTVPVLPGDYVLSESGGPDGYTASDWTCEGGTLTGDTVSVALGDSVTCTIVNDDEPAELTLVKEVVNDDGGTAVDTEWTLDAAGPTAGVTGPTGDAAVTAVVVDAGDYVLSETGPSGYLASEWTCEGATAAGGTVTVPNGGDVTCTVVNDDQPAGLTLVKEVVNDDGGTAVITDWTLVADGPTTGISGPSGDAAVTGVVVAAGDYVLSETGGPSGYTASDWTCEGGTLAGDTVTLANAETAVCTIVNDDEPGELTLVKEVVNDDGGTAVDTNWTLDAAGPTAGVSGPTGDAAVTAVVVDAGDYVLSESGGPGGYAASDWSCVGGALTGDTVTVPNGGSVTCTIVNDDEPADLTLVKEVVNDDGGTAVETEWTLDAAGPTTGISGPTGDVAVTGAPVLPGDYVLSESGGPSGYAASDWSCEGGTLTDDTVTIALGESVTCTIVNDDEPAELTLVKVVENDDGGTAAATDWTLDAAGPTTGVSGPTGDAAVTDAVVDAGDYVLSESGGPSGYTASDWQCVGGSLSGDTVTVPSGGVVTCAIVNDDEPGELTLVKEVVNDDGGTAVDTDWTLDAAGPTAGVSGPTGDAAVTDAVVDAGDYVLSESGPDGYAASDWTCEGGTLTDDTVTIALGESVTCTIVNDDEPGELTLVKEVVNDDGGTAVDTDWTLDAAGPTAGVTGPTGDAAVTAVPVDAGDYVLSESGPDGYAASDWTCEGGSLAGATVTVPNGESVVCTIVNDDEPGELTLVKQVVNDDGGTAVDTDWTLDAAGPTTGVTGPSGDAAVTAVPVDAGDYVLSETGGPDGYTASDWTCVGGALTGDTVTVANGGSVTCTIVNDDQPADLTLVKEVVNDDGGTAVDTDWTLDAAGPTTGVTGPTGDAAVTAVPVLPGDYVLSESGPDGYAPSDWSCVGGTLTGDTVGVALGDSVTCTIVNDDEPGELTLVKQVVNDDGGTAVDTDWTLDAAGPTAGISGPTGDAAVTAVLVDAGDYVLSETGGPSGYTASDWSCAGGSLAGDTVTVGNGESVVCTIVNDDEPGELTLVKEVVNDNGGIAGPTDWSLSADGPTAGITGPTGDAAVTDVPVDAGDYALAETGPSGYTASGWTCEGGTLTGDTVAVANGESVTCTIVNDDDQPLLVIEKTTTATEITVDTSNIIVYTITVTNTSAAVARDVVVTDTLRPGLTFAPGADPCISEDGRTIECELGDVGPGEVVSFDITVLTAPPLTPDAVDGDGMVPNTAAVTSPGSNCPPEDDPLATAVTTLAQANIVPAAAPCDSTVLLPVVPTVAVDKSTTTTTLVAGGQVAYDIVVTNTGIVTAPDVVAVDSLPDGLTYASSSGAPCTPSDGGATVTCDLGDLAPGEEVTVVIVADVADPFPTSGLVNGQVVNTVTITGAESNCGEGSADPACTDDAAVDPPSATGGPSTGGPSTGGPFGTPGDRPWYQLPFTGAPLGLMLAVGAALLAAGIAVTAGSRRRRS